MIQNGILHQSSHVNTSSYNRVSERKNRRHIETSRTLHFQMQIPKWANAVSTAF